jgi:hypothetical protein
VIFNRSRFSYKIKQNYKLRTYLQTPCKYVSTNDRESHTSAKIERQRTGIRFSQKILQTSGNVEVAPGLIRELHFPAIRELVK